MHSLVVLSGNPKPGSKTTAVAQALALELAATWTTAPSITVIELADLGGAVLDPGDVRTAARREAVAAADLVVVTTPSYKGSYTGLLKAFFDGYGPTSLSGVAAVAVTVAGSVAHAHVTGEFHLVPLLREVGAATPFAPLALVESEATDAQVRDARITAWMAAHRRWIEALATAEVHA